jgi:hypothetical protein
MKKHVSSESGIAIGVLLFGLAMLAVLAVAMSAGSNMMGASPITIDRISAEVKSQGQLILAKIHQCYSEGLDNKKLDCSNNTLVLGVPTRSGCSPIDTTAFYPTSTGSGTVIESVACPAYGAGIQNLWTGQQPSMLPPPSNGLEHWVYVNAGDAGGRCIRIQPLAAGVDDVGIRDGLAQAAGAFSADELGFSAGSSSQRFILWVTKPAGVVSADCSP